MNSEKTSTKEKFTPNRITYIEDYIDIVMEKYPFVPRQTVIYILTHGFRVFYWATRFGCDVSVISWSNRFWAICGGYYDTSTHTGRKWKNEKKQLKERFRWALNSMKKKWDGSFYFGLTHDRFLEDYYDKQDSEEFTFKRIRLYMNVEECKVATRKYGAVHFFKVLNRKSNSRTTYKSEFVVKREDLIYDFKRIGYNEYLKENDFAEHI